MRDGSGIARAAVAAAGIALLASGCGTASDQAQVQATAERFLAAHAAGDGGLACGQLSPALRQQVTKDEQAKTCADAVLKLPVRPHRIDGVRVYATSARVDLGGESFFLGATGSGWRIGALGCRPQGSGPYDCEEQA
jgi:hypothetical protein